VGALSAILVPLAVSTGVASAGEPDAPGLHNVSPGPQAPYHAVDIGPRGPGLVNHPLLVSVLGVLPDESERLSSAVPYGLSPAAVNGVYKLHPGGAGQIIMIVDAYHDPNALSDLNTFSSQYGLPTMHSCTSTVFTPGQAACFSQVQPQGGAAVDAGWVLE